MLTPEPELGVDAGAVAARVLAMPAAREVYGNEAVQEGLSPVGQPLVAQPGRNAGGPATATSRCDLA